MDVGKCHICEERANIRWCGVCQHWFCDECRKKYWARGLDAIKEMVGGRRPNCCGPG